MSDCTFDAAGCLVCPEESAVAYVPARIEHRAIIGWNAGANSILALDGGLHVVFTMPVGLAGVMVGLKGSRVRPFVPDGIEHGWYFQSLAGANLVRVVERGMAKTGTVAYTEDDVFEVRRFGGRVTYLKNDVTVYTSLASSTGAKIVNSCLYASGDHIGETA